MLKLYLFQVRARRINSDYGFARMELIAAKNPVTARAIVSKDYEVSRRLYSVSIVQLNRNGIKIGNITEQKKVGGGWLDLVKNK